MAQEPQDKKPENVPAESQPRKSSDPIKALTRAELERLLKNNIDIASLSIASSLAIAQQVGLFSPEESPEVVLRKAAETAKNTETKLAEYQKQAEDRAKNDTLIDPLKNVPQELKTTLFQEYQVENGRLVKAPKPKIINNSVGVSTDGVGMYGATLHSVGPYSIVNGEMRYSEFNLKISGSRVISTASGTLTSEDIPVATFSGIIRYENDQPIGIIKESSTEGERMPFSKIQYDDRGNPIREIFTDMDTNEPGKRKEISVIEFNRMHGPAITIPVENKSFETFKMRDKQGVLVEKRLLKGMDEKVLVGQEIADTQDNKYSKLSFSLDGNKVETYTDRENTKTVIVKDANGKLLLRGTEKNDTLTVTESHISKASFFLQTWPLDGSPLDQSLPFDPSDVGGFSPSITPKNKNRPDSSPVTSRPASKPKEK